MRKKPGDRKSLWNRPFPSRKDLDAKRVIHGTLALHFHHHPGSLDQQVLRGGLFVVDERGRAGRISLCVRNLGRAMHSACGDG